MTHATIAFSPPPRPARGSPARRRGFLPVTPHLPAGEVSGDHPILDAAAFLLLCLWTVRGPAAVRRGLDGAWDAGFADA